MLQGLTRMAPLREGEHPTNSLTTSMLRRAAASAPCVGWGAGGAAGAQVRHEIPGQSEALTSAAAGPCLPSSQGRRRK